MYLNLWFIFLNSKCNIPNKKGSREPNTSAVFDARKKNLDMETESGVEAPSDLYINYIK